MIQNCNDSHYCLVYSGAGCCDAAPRSLLTLLVDGLSGDDRAWKTYRLSKGPKFAMEKKKAATDLTYELLQR
jgi:hypothetical protein